MTNVPGALREKWGKVVSTVLRKILEARTSEETNLALMWFLLLPQAMLRQGKRGGGKGQNVAEVGKRFDCALAGNWGGLLDLLVADKTEAERTREGRRRIAPAEEEEGKEKLRETVLDLMSRGQIGRGARRITSNGVASMSDPRTMRALLAKYVDRTRDLPQSVSRGQCVDSLAGFREYLLELEPGVAPGTGGMMNEFLICLAQVWNPEEMVLMQEFGMRYLTAQCPPWFYRVWATVSAVPLFKTSDRDCSSLRPIGVKGALVRVLHKVVARRNRSAFRSYLEPQQLCCSPAGGHKLVHAVRMLLEENRDWICIKIDVENAHNSISRASILEVVEGEPELRHMAQHLATILSSPSSIETGGKVVGEAGDGLCQGEAESAGSFAAGLQPDVRRADEELKEDGGCAIFGHDDGYLLGPPAPTFGAFARFERRIGARCSLRLQRSKTEVFCWGELPSCTPPDLKRAGINVDGIFHPGFVCYGVAMGSDEFVRSSLDGKVEELGESVLASMDLLGADLQAMWTLLSSSVSQKLSYLTSLQYPSDMRGAAIRADQILWRMLEAATNLHIPRQDEGLGVECVLQPPVASMQDRSYQELIVRQPVRRGGWG